MLLLALLAIPAAMSAQTDKKVKVSVSDDGKSVLEVFLPAKDKATGKAVVICPGGGYAKLSMNNEGYDWTGFFNEQGVAAAVLTYRMPNGDRTIPMSDASRALKIMRDSAQAWFINPCDVGIMGFSAGGHLASTIATHNGVGAGPAFQLLFYPVISMNKKETHKGSCERFLGNEQDNEKLIKEFSNHKAVGRDTPPALILLSTDDRAVPPLTNGLPYYEALVRNNIEASLMAYPKGGHGWGYKEAFAYHNEMQQTVKKWIATHTDKDAAKNLQNSPYVGKKIAFIGDSYVANHRRSKQEAWHYKFAKKYGMQYYNYGKNGNCVSIESGKWGEPMYKRYGKIEKDIDYIVIIAGHNDATRIDSVLTIKEYEKRLSEMLTGMKKRYPQAQIMFISPWDCKDYKGSKRQRVVDATAKICKKLKVPFFNSAEDNTITTADDDFRLKYFQGPNDTAHLNAKGHDLFLPTAEKFLLSVIGKK